MQLLKSKHVFTSTYSVLISYGCLVILFLWYLFNRLQAITSKCRKGPNFTAWDKPECATSRYSNYHSLYMYVLLEVTDQSVFR